MPEARPVPLSLPSAVPGLTLRAWQWGREGVPVLLLHGFGMSGRVWDPIALALGPRRVFAPDARGHGDSHRGSEARDWYQTGVEDLEALTLALGPEPFTLVGHSMGANVAMRFTHLHPERVERLVLLDAGPDLPSARTRTRAQRPAPRHTPPLSGFASERAYAEALGVIYPRASPDTLLALAGHWLRRRPDGRFEPKLDPALLHAGRGAREPGSPWARTESERLWDQLAGIGCPLLIVRGEESRVLSRATARRMLSTSRDGRFEELAGAGHGLMFDAPHELASVLSRFLA
ncbi:MAG: alpha/beta hydrolase [Myxococcales bacterium]|nr:alpha/beta hydrolase [Myxococcales bacterium]